MDPNDPHILSAPPAAESPARHAPNFFNRPFCASYTLLWYDVTYSVSRLSLAPQIDQTRPTIPGLLLVLICVVFGNDISLRSNAFRVINFRRTSIKKRLEMVRILKVYMCKKIVKKLVIFRKIVHHHFGVAPVSLLQNAPAPRPQPNTTR